MKTLRLLLPIASALVAAIAVSMAAAQNNPDDPRRAEIADTARAFVAAFEREDAGALANFWAPEGDYIDINGRRIEGRDAIRADFEHLFAENQNLKLRIDVESLRFPTQDTAIEDGVTTVFSPDGGLPNRVRYTNHFIRSSGKWLLSSVRESAYNPPSNYDHLRALEWTIGEWSEDTEGPQGARAVFEWAPERNFIAVHRAVQVGNDILFNGSERIGWDPSTGVIRSWSFEADGGFGEGTWTRRDDRTWVIRTSSVLRSGNRMTATAVITRVDEHTITWQATNQRVDDQPVPDTAVITMKRVS